MTQIEVNQKEAEEFQRAINLLDRCQNVLDQVIEEKQDKLRFWETGFGKAIAKSVSVLTCPCARVHEKTQMIVTSPAHYYDSRAYNRGCNMLRFLKDTENVSARTIKKVYRIRKELVRSEGEKHQQLSSELKKALDTCLSRPQFDLQLLPSI